MSESLGPGLRTRAALSQRPCLREWLSSNSLSAASAHFYGIEDDLFDLVSLRRRVFRDGVNSGARRDRNCRLRARLGPQDSAGLRRRHDGWQRNCDDALTCRRRRAAHRFGARLLRAQMGWGALFDWARPLYNRQERPTFPDAPKHERYQSLRRFSATSPLECSIQRLSFSTCRLSHSSSAQTAVILCKRDF